MCLVIRWHCPACNEHTGMLREFRCPPHRQCQDRQLLQRPLERDLMQDWNCGNDECPYSVTTERAFRTRVYAARTLSEEGEAALAGNSGQMTVESPYNSSSQDTEVAHLTVSVVRPRHHDSYRGYHHDDTVSVESSPREHDSAPRYPSPPPGRDSYYYDEPYEPEEDEEDDEDEDLYPSKRRKIPSHPRRPQTRGFTAINGTPGPSQAYDDPDNDTEVEPAPSVSSTNSSIPNRPSLSNFRSFDGKHTAATWSLITKTKRTRNARSTDVASLTNAVLKRRIEWLHRWNRGHYDATSPEWSEEEKELLFLLKETLAFQTGSAMFGQEIYKQFFDYRKSNAALPHNMIEARANILRKPGKHSGEWWIQSARRELLILGMQPN